VTSAILRLLLALKQQQEEHKAHGSEDGSGNESGACAWCAHAHNACEARDVWSLGGHLLTVMHARDVWPC